MDTRNRLTAVRGDEGLDERRLEGRANEHTYITHRHIQQCGDGQRDSEGVRAGWRWAKGGEWGHL